MKEPVLDQKDQPRSYWFTAKTYGWGWTPATWQGWLVLLIYILAVAGCSLTIDKNSSVREVLFLVVLPMILLTITLIRICYKTGEKPRWQWGPRRTR